MIPLSLARIAQITGGELGHGDPAAVVSGEVVIDSRLVSPGGLFAAVAGERSDGHDFAAAAVAAGAVAVLATRPVPVPSVLVADVPAALAALARAVVDALPAAPDRRHHRLVRQDLDQGPGRPAGRAAGPDGRPGRLVQQRVRPSADRAARRRRDQVPGARAGRPRDRPHRLPVPRRAAPLRRRAERRPRARRRVRGWTRSRGPRASWSRRCPPAAWPCSTPTTPACWPWRPGPGRGWSPSAAPRHAPMSGPRTSALDDQRPRRRSPCCTPGGFRAGNPAAARRAQRANALAAAAAGRRARAGPGRIATALARARRAQPVADGGPRARGRVRSSTTPTTRTPNPSGPRSPPWRTCRAAGAASPSSARWPSSAASRASHEESASPPARAGDPARALAVGEQATPVLDGARRVRSGPARRSAVPDGAAALDVLAQPAQASQTSYW